MKIGVVAPLVAPLLECQSYGNHAFLLDLARGLASRGHQVMVYAAEGSSVAGVQVSPIPVHERLRRRFALLGPMTPEESGAMEAAFAALFDVLRQDGVDVVSQHAFDAPAFALCEPLPALHTMHLPPMVDAVVEAARSCTGSLCTVSSRCAELWRLACGRNISALPNGVPDMEVQVGAPHAFALIAGRISPEKGVDAALRVARRAGLHAVVVGEIYDRRYYDEQVEPELRGDMPMATVSREDLRRMMACAAVTLMPVAWEEPFGLVAAEAQMAGCPVVAYGRGALPEVVRHGVTGYLAAAGDEDGLVRGIGEAAAFDRAAIRRDAVERFAMDACIARYERELARLAG